jgi:hypothetical protein
LQATVAVADVELVDRHLLRLCEFIALLFNMQIFYLSLDVVL